MQLKHLVQNLPIATVEGPVDREVAGLVSDSRRVTPGMVFVAVPGLHVDGGDYISMAVDRGASAIICERSRLVSPRATRRTIAGKRERVAPSAGSVC